jgi:hypothetical protein
LWRPNPIADAEQFRGRTFIVIGAGREARSAFRSVEAPRLVTHYEEGHPVAQWKVTVYHGYRGSVLAVGGSSSKY